ncbi:MAG: tyrosine-type recombinase/integrase [Nostoc sp. CreGUA01]
MKKERAGQAAVFIGEDLEKILAHMPGQNHKMILRISYWSAGRAGEVCQLKTNDVFDAKGRPLTKLTYRPQTTKTKKTRQVPIHSVLRAYLVEYWKNNSPAIDGFLFPGAGDSPIQQQSYDDALRRAIKKAELADRGYSTHSPRRSILTEMALRGMALSLIQKFSGHESLESLQKYIDIEESDLELAIANF